MQEVQTIQKEEHEIIPFHTDLEAKTQPPPPEPMAPTEPDKTPSGADSLVILDALLGADADADKRVALALQFRQAIELLVLTVPLTEAQLRTIPDLYEPLAAARDDPLGGGRREN